MNHYYAVENVGRDVVFVKNNPVTGNDRVIGKGRSQSSMDGWIQGEVKERLLFDQVKQLDAAKRLGTKWVLPRFSKYDGCFLDSGFSDGEEIDELFEDIRMVDEFNLRYGMVPESFKDVPEYRYVNRQYLGYTIYEYPMEYYFRNMQGWSRDQSILVSQEHIPYEIWNFIVEGIFNSAMIERDQYQKVREAGVIQCPSEWMRILINESPSDEYRQWGHLDQWTHNRKNMVEYVKRQLAEQLG